MIIRKAPLERLVTAIFRACGCPDDEADRVATYLTRANLTGHDSHGVVRVPRYVEWIAEGRLVPGQSVEVVLDSGAVLVLDARHGLGQTVGPEAARMGMERAARDGVAFVALRNAGHLGRIGDFAEMAVDEGLVSIHFVNVYGSLLVAPFGGRERRTSTNPIAIGVPNAGGEPFILDFATSMVAEGKALVARQGGKPIPGNALVSAQGALTNDTDALYGTGEDVPYPDPTKGDGALRAFGDHKGSGLSLACDLLAGALTGSGANRGEEGRVHNGLLSIYMDPNAFGAGQGLSGEVENYIAWIKASAPTEGTDCVLIPGDKERASMAERQANGIPLPDQTWQAILGAAARMDLSQDAIDKLLEA